MVISRVLALQNRSAGVPVVGGPATMGAVPAGWLAQPVTSHAESTAAERVAGWKEAFMRSLRSVFLIVRVIKPDWPPFG
jgi:hypothetical protein